VGVSVIIYVSDSGRCSTEKAEDKCAGPTVAINISLILLLATMGLIGCCYMGTYARREEEEEKRRVKNSRNNIRQIQPASESEST
jgi:hypothetical protein